uniref:Striatin domain-containing protein n=1 Tax=Glossina austeni TaxID=7395 RepID=A0A1A9V3Q8_GLOAU
MGTNSEATTDLNNKPVDAGGGTGVVGASLGGGTTYLGVNIGNNCNNSNLSGSSSPSVNLNSGSKNPTSAVVGLVGVGNNITNSNSDDGNGGSAVTNNQQATIQYTIPGILHFMQHERSRFELERSHWDVCPAELYIYKDIYI